MKLSGKKVLLVGFIVALLVGIPLTVYLVQQQQETRSHAQKSTVLGFNPASTNSAPISVQAGQKVSFDITLNPGSNAVILTKLDIKYPADKFTVDTTSLTNNPNTFSTVIAAPKVTDGEITATFSTGADPTKVITTPVTVGTLILTAKSTTDNTPAQISFGPSTLVYSNATGDSGNENVLSSAAPAFIAVTGSGSNGGTPTPTTAFNGGGGNNGGGSGGNNGGGGGIGGNSCADVPPAVQTVTITYPYCPGGGTGCTADFTKADCSWTAVSGATSYSVKISQVNDDGTSVPVKSDTVSNGTDYVFSITQDKTYECDVAAVNSCGAGKIGTITALCAASAALVTPTATPLPPTVTPVPQPKTVPPVQNTPPTQKQTIPPTGPGETFVIIGSILAGITVIGSALFFLL